MQSSMSAPRFDTLLWARFEFIGPDARNDDDDRAEGCIRNVADGGMFVRSETLGRTGDLVRIRFEGPDGEQIEAIGDIRWTCSNLPGRGPGHHGFGLRLQASSGAYRQMMRNFAAPLRKPPRRRPRVGLAA